MLKKAIATCLFVLFILMVSLTIFVFRSESSLKMEHQRKNLTENVLPHIPHMEYGNPSAVCYIGSVMRLMDYLGDPVEADELFSLSGTA